jgi:hypothetical protein
MSSVKLLLIFSVVLSFCGSSARADFWSPPYFWREKSDVQKKMIEDRYVPVSVDHGESGWTMKGAGRVQAPGDFVYGVARDFERLKKLDHFKKAEWNETAKTLDVIFAVIGKEIAITYKLIEEIPKGAKKRMVWEAVQGAYKGSKLAILIEDTGSQECEAILFSIYDGRIGWMPDFMISLAVEGVLHHVATSLRSETEKEWKDNAIRSTK